METSRWQRIEEIFHLAADFPDAERGQFLIEACAGDEELRAEVESLLVSSLEVGTAIEGAVRAEAADVIAEDSTVGRRLGPYELVRELGHGGMGTVYLARRADDAFHREVAIKLVRGGVASRDVVRRFRSERQILASLDHPNIARLLDGGSTRDGLPYLVMEYIEGQRIDRYCDRRRLSTGERLALFETICAAVEHAHQHLVVHCDLKPANILVTPDGTIKLLDFGISKILAPEAIPFTVVATKTVERRLTPDWASPEQLRGERVTTRTDVYALGLLLYVLLAGRHPFRRSTGVAAPAHRDTRPLRPSTVVSKTDPASDAAAVSRARRTVPERLRKRLAGDLDNIVLMAMRNEPERRYASVEHLADDVRRHRQGLPVEARSDAPGYRARKFVERHRWGVAVSAFAVAAAVGLGAYHTAEVTRERDRAQREAAKAERVSHFLQDLFTVADPNESLGETVTARELLRRGAAEVEGGLAAEPDVQASMMQAIGNVYGSLGLLAEARPLLEKALRLRESLHSRPHREVADSLDDLGELLQELGERARARELYLRALAIRREVFGAEHGEVAVSLARLAMLDNEEGRRLDAEKAMAEALALGEKTLDADAPELEDLLNAYGHVSWRLGRVGRAEALFRRAMEHARRIYGDLHPQVDANRSMLAVVLQDKGEKGNLEEAETLLRESIAYSRKVFGDVHVSVATRLTNLSAMLKERGAYAEAEALQREALEMDRALYGDRHGRVATDLNNLANLLHDQSDFEGARALHHQALELNRSLFGNEHPRVAGSLANLSALLEDLGDYEAAEPLRREALRIDSALLGEDHHYVAMDHNGLAGILMEQGRMEEAERHYLEALALSREARGDDHLETAIVRSGLGRLLTETGRAEEGEPHLRSALALRRERLPPEHEGIAQAEAQLGACLAAQGRYEEAEPLLVSGYEALRTAGARQQKHAERARRALSALYEVLGKAEEAARSR